MASREVRVTGGRDTITEVLRELLRQVEESETTDVEAELVVKPNAPSDPELVLNFNSTDCDDDDVLLVEYEELSDA